jgi:hypothetical protein
VYTTERKDLNETVNHQIAKCNEYLKIKEKLSEMEMNHFDLRKEFEKNKKKRAKRTRNSNSDSKAESYSS